MEAIMKKFKFAGMMVLILTMMGINMVVHAQTDVTLTAWTHDQLYINYFESRLDEFKALHPDINLTFEPTIDSAAPANALNAIAAGEQGPDLLGLERGQFPNFMRNGIIAEYFLDLTDRIGDRREDYAEGRWTIYSYEGRLYGIESSLTASVLYYQPAIFEAAGVEVPTTWEQVLSETGPALVANGSAFTFATNDGSGWFQMYLNQRGGAIFDKDGNFVLGDETNRPLAIEVSTFIQKAVQNGTFMVVLGGDVWGGATLPTAYQEGRLAGTVMPDWWASCCLKSYAGPEMEGKWRAAAPPVWEGGGYKTLNWGGTGWVVSSKSPNAELAWEFLEFMYLGARRERRRDVQTHTRPHRRLETVGEGHPLRRAARQDLRSEDHRDLRDCPGPSARVCGGYDIRGAVDAQLQGAQAKGSEESPRGRRHRGPDFRRAGVADFAHRGSTLESHHRYRPLEEMRPHRHGLARPARAVRASARQRNGKGPDSQQDPGAGVPVAPCPTASVSEAASPRPA
jgi:ABC-type glycerol-3-phosphate transport system substrate-binding protein